MLCCETECGGTAVRGVFWLQRKASSAHMLKILLGCKSIMKVGYQMKSRNKAAYCLRKSCRTVMLPKRRQHVVAVFTPLGLSLIGVGAHDTLLAHAKIKLRRWKVRVRACCRPDRCFLGRLLSFRRRSKASLMIFVKKGSVILLIHQPHPTRIIVPRET